MFIEFQSSNLEKKFQSVLKRITKNKADIDNLLKIDKKNYNNFVQPLVLMNQRLYCDFTILSHLNSVKNSKETQELYSSLIPPLTQYYSELNQNEEIFFSFQTIFHNEKNLSIEQKKVLDNNLINFKLAGVHLEKNLKQRIEIIETELSNLNNQFSQNVLEASSKYKITLNEAQVEEFPNSVKNFSLTNEGKYEFSLKDHSYSAFVTYCSDRKLKESMYKAYMTRAPENLSIIEKILALRTEKAKILNFKNFAEYSLQTKSANSPEEVLSYLKEIVQIVKPFATKELDELKSFAKENFQINDLKPYDIAFISEKLKKHKYNLNEEDYKPYFEKNRVVEGTFEFLQKIFGIRFEKIKAEAWDKDVYVYNLIFKEKIQARLYLDLETRQEKQSGAWMNHWYSKTKFANIDIKPVAFVVCNFPPSNQNTPSLLTHNDVVTFFHEMGHALHHICSQISEPEVSGVNGVEWDIVEFPSQFLENFAYEADVLQIFAKHYKTEENLSLDKIQTLKKAKNHLSALGIIRQMEFALFDFLIHYKNLTSKQEVQKILDEVRKEISVIEVPAYNHFQSSFLHIFAGGYAAGYYSYKWAEILSADAFMHFIKNGTLNKHLGKKYLETVLKQGGSKNGLKIFEEFMGRSPRKEALLEMYEIL